MLWVKLATKLCNDERVLKVGDVAFGLYCRALAYCGLQENDGRVPLSFVIGRQRKFAERLVAAGLWARTPDGWEIVGYLDTQLSSKKIRKNRADALERKRRSLSQRDSLRDSQSASRVTSTSTSSLISKSSDRETRERRDDLVEKRNREYARRVHGL